MSGFTAQFDVPVDDFDVSIPGSGEGEPIDTGILLAEKSIQFSGTFVATMKLEASNDDGENWTQIGSDITTPGLVEIETMVASMRINLTSHTSGTPVAWLCGLRQSW